MIQRYDQINDALAHLCDILSTKPPLENGGYYVPSVATVRLLRRANALCARNMVACDFFVESESPKAPSAKPKRSKRGPR